MIELYRCIVPSSVIINDNHGTHYRVHQNCMLWLNNQFYEIYNGIKTISKNRGKEKIQEKCTGPGGFKMPDVNKIKNFINNETISIRCEVWKCNNRIFDPQNYAKNFKVPIDLLTHNEYLIDDNWKFIDGITYCGGGINVWNKRAFRYENDGLPDNLNLEWWGENGGEDSDIMLRILIDKIVNK